MITGVHAIIFSGDATATREFFRDTLGLPSIDAGQGWLIFSLPPAELAAHPTAELAAHPTAERPHHELYLMCDDVHATVMELQRKGVEFTRGIAEERWGLTTAFSVPGGGEMVLYEPLHPRPPLTE